MCQAQRQVAGRDYVSSSLPLRLGFGGSGWDDACKVRDLILGLVTAQLQTRPGNTLVLGVSKGAEPARP